VHESHDSFLAKTICKAQNDKPHEIQFDGCKTTQGTKTQQASWKSMGGKTMQGAKRQTPMKLDGVWVCCCAPCDIAGSVLWMFMQAKY